MLVDARRAAAAAARRLEEAALNLLLGTLDVLVGARGTGAAAVDAVEEAALLGLTVGVEVNLLLEHPLGAADPLLLRVRIGVRRVVPGAEVLGLLDHGRKAHGRGGTHDGLGRGGTHDGLGLWDSQALALVACALLGDPLLGPGDVAPTDVRVIERENLRVDAVLNEFHGTHRLGRVARPRGRQAVVDDGHGLDLDERVEAVVARARRHFG